MYSELSISGFEKEYNLFGLSVLGMNQELWKKNNPGETNIKRRLHFNLLATHTSNKLMDEILSIWKDSTEAFENDFIYGIKIIKCSNVFILIKDIFLNFITLLRKSKEFIVSILTIIVAISTATFININDSIPSQILAIFNWIFLIIVLVLSITNLIYFLTKKYKYRDTKRTIYVLTKKNRDNIEYALKKENKVLRKLMLMNDLREAHTKDDKLKIKNKFKKSNVFSPIGIIMNLLYLRDL